MLNFDVLTGTTSDFDFQGVFTGYHVWHVNLYPLDAIIGVIGVLIILTVVLWKKI